MSAEAGAVQASKDDIAELIMAGQHREALIRCTREYSSALGRLAMALLGSQAEAEEVVQDALVAAYKAMDGYRGEASSRAWLFGIARRMCAKHLEKRGRRRRILRAGAAPDAVLGTASIDETAASPAAQLDDQRQRQRLHAALGTLKPSDREVVTLRYQSGLSYQEIAAACGIAETAARKRCSRALLQLRKLLTDEVAS